MELWSLVVESQPLAIVVLVAWIIYLQREFDELQKKHESLQEKYEKLQMWIIRKTDVTKIERMTLVLSFDYALQA